MQILMSHSLCLTSYIYLSVFSLSNDSTYCVFPRWSILKKSNCTRTPISVTSSEQVNIWFSVLKRLNFSWLQNFPRIHQVLWVKSFFETLHNPDGLSSHLLTQQHPLAQTHSMLPRTRALHGQGSPAGDTCYLIVLYIMLLIWDMQICFHLGMIISQYPQRSVTERQQVLRFSVFLLVF